ncbi:unnamed protein product [Mucor hiemalis]
MNASRAATLLQCTRIFTLITAGVIVLGSLSLYSSNALPLNITDDDEQDASTWIIQSITDRRLISTLVAAQASIFCPLFILLNPKSGQEIESSTTCMIEVLCQLLMPLGLALSWMFSILFDAKTTELTGRSDMCLLEDISCVLFGFIHGLKYVIVLLFAIETSLVGLQYVMTRFHSHKIQLPLDEEEEKNSYV